jgi:hypothetical protein
MSTQPIHFKIVIKEINIEFDGDMEAAQIAQGAVNNFMNSLTEIQNKLLQLETQIPERSNGSSNQPPPLSKRRAKRRSSGESPIKGHIIRLREEGFFEQKRLLGEVRDKLAQQGHNYKSPSISSPILALTKNRILFREKNEEGNWIYWMGDNDGSGES